MPKIELPPKTKTANRGDGASSRSHKLPASGSSSRSTKVDLAIRPKDVSKMAKIDGTMRPKDVSKMAKIDGTMRPKDVSRMAKMNQTIRPKELPIPTKKDPNQKSTAQPKSTKEDQAKLALVKARPSAVQKTDSGQRDLARRDNTTNTETHSEKTVALLRLRSS